MLKWQFTRRRAGAIRSQLPLFSVLLRWSHRSCPMSRKELLPGWLSFSNSICSADSNSIGTMPERFDRCVATHELTVSTCWFSWLALLPVSSFASLHLFKVTCFSGFQHFKYYIAQLEEVVRVMDHRAVMLRYNSTVFVFLKYLLTY